VGLDTIRRGLIKHTSQWQVIQISKDTGLYNNNGVLENTTEASRAARSAELD